jgi:hypothetical protein
VLRIPLFYPLDPESGTGMNFCPDPGSGTGMNFSGSGIKNPGSATLLSLHKVKYQYGMLVWENIVIPVFLLDDCTLFSILQQAKKHYVL